VLSLARGIPDEGPEKSMEGATKRMNRSWVRMLFYALSRSIQGHARIDSGVRSER
jgi:hypothetical protein